MMTATHSLSERIGELLGQRNPQAEQLWHQHFRYNPAYGNERRHINEFLRLQLGAMPMDTTTQRECLNTDSSDADYLRHFETYVAPFIVKHGLPAWRQMA